MGFVDHMKGSFNEYFDNLEYERKINDWWKSLVFEQKKKIYEEKKK